MISEGGKQPHQPKDGNGTGVGLYGYCEVYISHLFSSACRQHYQRNAVDKSYGKTWLPPLKRSVAFSRQLPLRSSGLCPGRMLPTTPTGIMHSRIHGLTFALYSFHACCLLLVGTAGTAPLTHAADAGEHIAEKALELVRLAPHRCALATVAKLVDEALMLRAGWSKVHIPQMRRVASFAGCLARC